MHHENQLLPQAETQFPNAVQLDEVADPGTLWALVLEGELLPTEDKASD